MTWSNLLVIDRHVNRQRTKSNDEMSKNSFFRTEQQANQFVIIAFERNCCVPTRCVGVISIERVELIRDTPTHEVWCQSKTDFCGKNTHFRKANIHRGSI